MERKMETSFPNTYGRNKVHPKKFALLIACASIMMMFAALTSAYIVRHAAGNWLEFSIPNMFAYSSAVIIASSLALHTAYSAYLKGNEQVYKYGVVAALVLGLIFIVLQYAGWVEMSANGVDLDTNPSAPFVYVISGFHAAHVLGGIAALIVAVLHAFTLPYKVTAKRKLRFELTFIYWHFVDLLWIYLYLFLLMQQA
jgi:cytochrome c oxidase subunit 3